MTEDPAPPPYPPVAAPGGMPPPGSAAGPPPTAPTSPTGGDDAPRPPGGYPPPSGGASFTSRYGLVRPRDGRYLAGVCAAIGRATNTDPVLWRVLLAVLGFFGGVGILVYVAAWLIIPGEGDSASPLESMLGRGRSSMSPITVIVLTITVAVGFGYIVTDAFRAVLLGAAILIGGALLLNRDSRSGAPAAGPAPGPATPPGLVPPVGWPAPAPFTPAATAAPVLPFPPGRGGLPTGWPPARTGEQVGWPAQTSTAPLPAWPPAAPMTLTTTRADAPNWPPRPPVTGGPTAAPVTVPPPPGTGYRPPFAPHGPYAGGNPPPVPPAPRVKPPKKPKERSALGAATFSLIFLALGVVAILDLLDVFPISAAGYFAAVLATIGLGLLVGTWFGRARWLIALGLVAAAALGVATVAESYDRVRGVDGAVTWAPTSYQDLADRYENSFGDATLDLRAVDFDKRDTDLTVVVNFGEATIVVPPNVDVTAVTNVKAGEATVFGRRTSGMEGQGRQVTDPGLDGAGGGTLRLTVHVNAGNLEVIR
ncbi:phage shock protein C (PspC) family protein [Micromonospora matsumotoense]|uniref:Phage shock protein C (PspC) family protein n=1 Tax=Micromonospora matsumotoense TaxID=121616 RepID=A0A1C4WE52_9ACTN|nr:PspC domain-containing protein [Micromonospora matsumotoense]SCE94201.1 phage shock protein C (PspC) family protein [Micromonospora matsumotoense]